MYIAVITIFIDDYYLIFLLQGIYIIGAALDISWFYAGTEKFKIPSLSNIVASGIVLVSLLSLSKINQIYHCMYLLLLL